MSAAASQGLRLQVLPHRLGVARLPATAALPFWFDPAQPMTSVTRTREELSVVCEEQAIPHEVRAERGFRVIQVVGPLDFALIGILSVLTRALAEAEVSVFALSTFDTDYLLVRDHRLDAAVAALRSCPEVAEVALLEG